MRLLKLTIQNLASIEAATIDFEHGPLAYDSLFLICGPTGSGKTTLLDALCLALYGTTPRLEENGTKEKYSEKTENFKSSGDDGELSVSDPRALMRRGSDCARVELLFTDSNDHPLKAQWSVERARTRAGYVKNGKIQEVRWTLSEPDDTLVSGKVSETRRLIAERVGLSFRQFTRTVMLAQGDFTKFLKSSEGEKSEILEKLTGTEIYSEISIEIHRQKSEKEAALRLIEERLRGIRLLSDDERAQIDEAMRQAAERLAALAEQEKQLQTQLKWLNDEAAARLRLGEAARRLYEHTAQQQSEAALKRRRLLADWERTADPRALLHNRLTLTRELDDRTAAAERLHATFDELSGGLAAFAGEMEQRTALLKTTGDYLDGEQRRAALYKNVALVDSLLTQVTAARRTLAAEQKKMEKNAALVERATERQSACRAALERAEADEKARRQSLAEARRLLQSLDIAALTEQHRRADRLSAELVALRQLLLSQGQAQEQLVATEKVQAQQSAQLAALQQEADRLAADTAQKEQAAKEQATLYEKQQLSCSDILRELRSRLAQGDHCPLCGQKIEQLADDSTFSSLLAPVKARLDELRTQAEAARAALHLHTARIGELKKSLLRTGEERERHAAALQSAQRALEAHPQWSRFAPQTQPAEAVDAAAGQSDEEKRRLAAQLEGAATQQREAERRQKECDRALEAVKKAEKSCREGEAEMAKLNAAIEVSRATIATCEATVAENLRQAAEFITVERWEAAPDDFMAKLRSAAQRYEAAQLQAQRLETELAAMQQQREAMQQARSAIEEKFEEWRNGTPRATAGVERLAPRWGELRTAALSNCDAVATLRTKLQEGEAALQRYFGSPEAVTAERLAELAALESGTVERLRSDEQQQRDAATRLKTEKEGAERTLAQLTECRPFADGEATPAADDTAAALQAAKEQAGQLNRSVGEQRQRLAQDAESRRLLADTLTERDRAAAHLELWSRLHQLLGSADGKKFRNIAQSYVLNRLLCEGNRYLSQLTGRYRMECQPGSLTILLRDLEAGGVTRPVTTISGGESFLVSLALALGLSALSHSTLAVDTLFIDEGFGTLDSEHLSTVMEALERLHQMGGKRVGIISHVESLKERLTTQIQLVRVNATLSRVEVKSLL